MNEKLTFTVECSFHTGCRRITTHIKNAKNQDIQYEQWNGIIFLYKVHMMRFLWLHCMCSYLKNKGYFVLKIKSPKCWSTIFNSQLETISEILHHSPCHSLQYCDDFIFKATLIWSTVHVRWWQFRLLCSLRGKNRRIKIRRPHCPLNFPTKRNQRTW